MGRHTQLARSSALEHPPVVPAGPPVVPATVAAPVVGRGGAAPLGWGATARAILPAFLITRAVTLVAGVLGAAIWGVKAGSSAYFDPAGLSVGLGSTVDRLVGPYTRFDAVWFLDIANQGYPTSYEPRTAFFPLYPVLLHTGGAVLGSPVIAGILISSVCAFAGAMLLHRLTELELGRPAAGMAVWALMVFPGSLWLTAVYSEGLFLVVSVACLYFARERRWAAVAAFGALAATTRSAGVVLVVPILVMAWQGRARVVPERTGATSPAGGPRRDPSGPDGSPGALVRRGTAWAARELHPGVLRDLRPGLLSAAAVVGGLLLFVVGLRLAGHSWTVSFDQQQQWGRRNVGPIDGVVESVRAARDGLSHLFHPVAVAPGETAELTWMDPLLLVFLIAGLAALVGAARRLPPAYAAYAGCALLLPLSAPATEGTGPLMSLPRFLGVLFPLAMWTGWWLTRGRWQRGRQIVLGVLGIGLLALFSELTTRWLFVA